MGGALAHEFMAICDAGEDTLIICDKCGYKANKDIATSIIEHYKEKEEALQEVATPDCQTIEEVANYLKVPTHKRMTHMKEIIAASLIRSIASSLERGLSPSL